MPQKTSTLELQANVICGKSISSHPCFYESLIFDSHTHVFRRDSKPLINTWLSRVVRKSSAELLGGSRLGKSLSLCEGLAQRASSPAQPQHLRGQTPASTAARYPAPAQQPLPSFCPSTRQLQCEMHRCTDVQMHGRTDAQIHRCTDARMQNCSPVAQLVHSPSTIRQVELKLPALICPYFLSSFPSPACHYRPLLWTRSCSCSLPMAGPRQSWRWAKRSSSP